MRQNQKKLNINSYKKEKCNLLYNYDLESSTEFNNIIVWYRDLLKLYLHLIQLDHETMKCDITDNNKLC